MIRWARLLAPAGHAAEGCVRIESPSGLGGGLVRGAVPLRVAGAVV